MNVFNEPSYEQFEQMNQILQSIADKERIIQDLTNSPGPKVLSRGDTQAGFYGFVWPNEMGTIDSNPSGSQEYNGTNLALALGISRGKTYNSDVPLIKFHYKGKVLLIPLT